MPSRKDKVHGKFVKGGTPSTKMKQHIDAMKPNDKLATTSLPRVEKRQ